MATSAIKLTKRTVDALLPRKKPFIVFDADVKGFGLRIMPTGVKTFIFEYRPGAGGRGVAKRRLTLGRYGGAMTVDQARKAMSRLMLKSAKRASLIENLRSLRGLGKMRVR